MSCRFSWCSHPSSHSPLSEHVYTLNERTIDPWPRRRIWSGTVEQRTASAPLLPRPESLQDWGCLAVPGWASRRIGSVAGLAVPCSKILCILAGHILSLEVMDMGWPTTALSFLSRRASERNKKSCTEQESLPSKQQKTDVCRRFLFSLIITD